MANTFKKSQGNIHKALTHLISQKVVIVEAFGEDFYQKLYSEMNTLIDGLDILVLNEKTDGAYG
jgi:hypothetical protein